MDHLRNASTTVWSRLRDRIGRRGAERGDVLVETLVFMAVISLVAGAYTSSASNANRASRTMTAIEVVDQQAQGVLERAQVQPWELLGINPAIQGRYKNNEWKTEPLGAGKGYLVTHEQEVSSDAAQTLKPYTTMTTRGVRMEQSVYITWSDGKPLGTDSGAYGSKKITVKIDYKAPGVAARTKTFTGSRSATPTEAIPDSVKHVSDIRDRTPEAPAAVCPSPHFTRDSQNRVNGMRWERVPGAAHYRIWAFEGNAARYDHWQSNAGGRHTRTEAALAVEQSARWASPNMRWMISPSLGGVEIDCEPMTATNWNLPIPACTTGVVFEADGRTLRWNTVEYATSYVVFQRVNGAITGSFPVPQGQTHFTLPQRLPGSSFQVRGSNHVGSNAGCASWTPPTPVS